MNRFGFLEAPCRKIDKETGRVTDEVVYMTADVEDEYTVAQATEPTDEKGYLLNDRITCRRRNEIISVDRADVDYIDVSPKMMVSIATAMIPFLENDDANRALMGANMQRQAVPLLTTEAPIVATGQEYKNCQDSEVAILAEGYTTAEMDSFYHHAAVAVESILKHEPFKSRADDFNFVAVASPSIDSGVSVPRLSD